MKEVKDNSYSYYYHTNYVRNSRAIAIAWAIFTICFAIILIVVFVQPYWIGDGREAQGVGYAGLYHVCVSFGLRGEPDCTRDIFDFGQIDGNSALVAATVFVGLGVIFVLLSVCGMCCFMCRKPTTATVFRICGVLQLLTGVFVLIGIIVYPAGWDHSVIQSLCGSDSYDLGGCQLRWVFVLAIVAVFDAIILGILALLLASKHDKLHPEHFSEYYAPKAGKYSEKGSVSRASIVSRNFNVNPLPVGEGNDDDRSNAASSSHHAASPVTNPTYATIQKRNKIHPDGSDSRIDSDPGHDDRQDLVR
ncbi:LHFPL tetraspan subfamily member 3 protein-like [Antedon mediterranea]|uniref:LHFPL tetraspan subfamily member 3 protein-like n=1 Tax=Antedon mediterranea TaxID=105859 RepID=UPI003AF6DBBC